MSEEYNTIGNLLPTFMASAGAWFRSLASVCWHCVTHHHLFILIDSRDGIIWETSSSRIVEWKTPPLGDSRNVNVFSDNNIKTVFLFAKKDAVRLHFALGRFTCSQAIYHGPPVLPVTNLNTAKTFLYRLHIYITIDLASLNVRLVLIADKPL